MCIRDSIRRVGRASSALQLCTAPELRRQPQLPRICTTMSFPSSAWLPQIQHLNVGPQTWSALSQAFTDKTVRSTCSQAAKSISSNINIECHNVAGRMIIRALGKSPWGAGSVNADIGSDDFAGGTQPPAHASSFQRMLGVVLCTVTIPPHLAPNVTHSKAALDSFWAWPKSLSFQSPTVVHAEEHCCMHTHDSLLLDSLQRSFLLPLPLHWRLLLVKALAAVLSKPTCINSLLLLSMRGEAALVQVPVADRSHMHAEAIGGHGQTRKPCHQRHFHLFTVCLHGTSMLLPSPHMCASAAVGTCFAACPASDVPPLCTVASLPRMMPALLLTHVAYSSVCPFCGFPPSHIVLVVLHFLFELLQAHVEARKRMAAVLTIQRCYRQWRSRVGAQRRAAQIGAGLVMDSMSVLRVRFTKGRVV
eukprot:1151777-Pelagomonas_calceolata.AAC.1